MSLVGREKKDITMKYIRLDLRILRVFSRTPNDKKAGKNPFKGSDKADMWKEAVE